MVSGNRTTVWPNNSTPGYIFIKKKLFKTLIQKDTCTPVLTATLFTIVKIWKWPKCPSTDEWIKKVFKILAEDIL